MTLREQLLEEKIVRLQLALGVAQEKNRDLVERVQILNTKLIQESNVKAQEKSLDGDPRSIRLITKLGFTKLIRSPHLPLMQQLYVPFNASSAHAKLAQSAGVPLMGPETSNIFSMKFERIAWDEYQEI